MICFKGVILTDHFERTFFRISLDGTQAFPAVTQDDLEEELTANFLNMCPFNLDGAHPISAQFQNSSLEALDFTVNCVAIFEDYEIRFRTSG